MERVLSRLHTARAPVRVLSVSAPRGSEPSSFLADDPEPATSPERAVDAPVGAACIRLVKPVPAGARTG